MIHAFAAFEAGRELKPFEYDPGLLDPMEALIQITHCGLCYSDVHLIDDDWRISRYPLVPGHEIIGTVLQIGSSVKKIQPGQRVGVGWQCGACFECSSCIQGQEVLCSSKVRTCVEKHGGFADQIAVDARFIYPIPDVLSSETAAPLLCGGITVYSPFKIYNIQAPMSVAVVGIGGLGHLALQFAKAFGCDVTALSSSQDKEAEARKFGAAHFFTLSQLPPPGTFDFILSTAHGDLDWNHIASLLKPNGRLCFVGLPNNPIQIAARILISGNRSICGNGTGSRAMMLEMLQFAARHRIAAQTEPLPMSQINNAIARIKNNQARYRIVLFN